MKCPYCRATLGKDADTHVLACHLHAMQYEGKAKPEIDEALKRRKPEVSA